MKVGAIEVGDGSGSCVDFCQHLSIEVLKFWNFASRRHHTHLYIFNYAVISKVSSRSNSSCGECIWDDVQNSSSSGVGNRQGRDWYYMSISICPLIILLWARYNGHRLWSLRYTVGTSSVLLLTFPILHRLPHQQGGARRNCDSAMNDAFVEIDEWLIKSIYDLWGKQYLCSKRLRGFVGDAAPISPVVLYVGVPDRCRFLTRWGWKLLAWLLWL